MTEQLPRAGAWTRDDNTVTFTIWAPLKKSMHLILEDTNERHTLTKDKLGYWSINLPEIKSGTNYLFQPDDGKPLPDPASRHQPGGVHGPSAVVHNHYAWTDDNWTGKALGEMVIYELHVGTFTTQGTFEGIISKLAYLKDLGINAIEIMPVAQFPGNRNWGYDGVYPFAVQDSYGGAEGLKQLVNKAHQAGIAVILDVVYNHQGPEGNYLSAFGPYFTDKYKTGWGSAINFDDAWSDGVRNFYWQNALMWLDEFHIDGLRLDAVHAIWDSGAKHFIHELKRKTAELEKQSGRKKILIAEFDLNNPRYINAESKGGYGLDGQWIDEFHHALHAITTGEKNGYYEDFGDTAHLIKSFKDSYIYTGQYSVHRKKNFGAPANENPYSQFIVFSQNHDQIGNRLLGDRLTTLLSFESLKLVAATTILSPHVPMLFMGEEYGEKNPFQYFISHTDKELVEMVRKGRKEEFSYFEWKEEIPDPQSEETFEKCKLSWPFEHPEQANTLFQFYKYLIGFRKDRIAMRSSTRESLQIVPIQTEGIVSFERTYQDDTIQIILNFNKVSETIELSNRPYSMIFDSSDQQWGGPGVAAISHNKITINKESVIILEK